jgi:hypothetical protein
MKKISTAGAQKIEKRLATPTRWSANGQANNQSRGLSAVNTRAMWG